MATGRGLDQFKGPDPLPDDSVPRTLFVCMDWPQTQWRVIFFLEHKERRNVEGIMEVTHRRNRDFNLATAG